MSSQRSIPTVDRISSLPDSVICHILSFFPTEQSAATSILSKRWYPLWLSVPTLHFDDGNFADFATFRHFVYSVLLSGNITRPLQSFRLKCGNSSGFNPHDVNRFVNAVVQRRIQNLNVEMFPCFKLPTCVFSCTNLTVLKLKNLRINYSSEVNFPLLKTLHLDSIFFHEVRDEDFVISRLFNGCPILEDLKTKDLLLPDSVKLIIRAGEFNGLLKLVRANILNLHMSIPFNWARNAKFLCAKLKRPYYDDQVPTFPNLTHMEIVFKLRNDWLGKWKWLTQVLQNCPNLQNLTIHEDMVNEIGDNDWVDPPIVPECLSSHLKTCSLIAFKGMKCELQFAEYILKNAKALNTMKISASPGDSNIKLQMLMKLSLCPRGSATCKLSFD